MAPLALPLHAPHDDFERALLRCNFSHALLLVPPGGNGFAQRTPLLESLVLNNLTGARVLVKAEALQTAGSFKIRGALNRVLCLSEEQRARGVVAFSSGNFGQGLAVRPPGEPLLPAWRAAQHPSPPWQAACGSQGVGCTVVMPGDAPLNKEERARQCAPFVPLLPPPEPPPPVRYRWIAVSGSASINARLQR